MGKPEAAAPADVVALYEALIATLPDVERKGAKLPYTAVNGNMFSMLTARGTLSLRLPEPDRSAFLARHGAKLTEQYGVVQKEYVEVPDAVLRDAATMTRLFAASFAYAKGLRPKPTTKPKT